MAAASTFWAASPSVPEPSISAGATFQFSPHWSINIEDRYLFLGDSSVNMFRVESEYDISGNQIFLGFSYSL